MYIQQGLTIAKLQKRINDILGVIEDNHLSHLDALLLIVDILKGEQNET